MDIVFETSIYSQQKIGGISRIFNEIIPILCNYPNYHVTLLSIEKSIQPLPVHSRLKTISFSNWDKILRPRRIWRHLYEDIAIAILRDTSKKILHSTYYHSIISWKGPIALHIYDMIYESYPNFYCHKYERYFVQRKKREIDRADLLICISKTTESELKSLYPNQAKKTAVVYPAVSDIFRTIHSEHISKNNIESKPFILYVGSRGLYKNYKELLNAYARWNKRDDFTLYAVGPEWTDEEKRTINSLGLGSQVLLLSCTDDQHLCNLYNQASAFVFPSLYEGFGIPILEAMACSCPIVASLIPSTVEIAGTIPYYFDLGNLDSFISALDNAVLEDKSSERVVNGLNQVKKFSWEKSTQEIIKLYDRLI